LIFCLSRRKVALREIAAGKLDRVRRKLAAWKPPADEAERGRPRAGDVLPPSAITKVFSRQTECMSVAVTSCPELAAQDLRHAERRTSAANRFRGSSLCRVCAAEAKD